jgi:hypothetical protein
MTDHRPDDARSTDPSGSPSPATLAEDLLLLLFQPESGTIAGEGTLYYVLAGAVLADLALDGRVGTEDGKLGTLTVRAVDDVAPPSDASLRATWDYVAGRARGVQTVLAATGPTLREPLLDRLVERGDIRRTTRKTLGLFSMTSLTAAPSGRREELLADVRAALVDGIEPTPRVAALAALIYGSGTLPQFDPVIPWTSPVIARAEALQAGNWGASAAAEAVMRTMAATIIASIAAATSTLPRN